jgi:hypothetical protein
VGRSVTETNVPTNYNSPLNMMARIADYTFRASNGVSLLANDTPEGETDVGTIQRVECNLNNNNLSGFTKLGISANVQAWLLDMDTVTGDYGLKITIEYEDMVI